MFRPLIAVLFTFAIIKVGLDLIMGSNFSVDLWLTRMSLPPALPLTEVLDIFAPIVTMFPLIPVLSLTLLFAWGLLSLLEMD